MTTDTDEVPAGISLAVFGAIVVGFALIIGACVWTNLAWAPHAADIELGRQTLQRACIERGGIWRNGIECVWSGAQDEATK